jgi:hypothetical protein
LAGFSSYERAWTSWMRVALTRRAIRSRAQKAAACRMYRVMGRPFPVMAWLLL